MVDGAWCGLVDSAYRPDPMRPILAYAGRLSSALLLTFAACGDDDVMPVEDGGPPPDLFVNTDGGPPDGGPVYGCDVATVIEGVMGETSEVTFDTAMTEERPRDLGDCGNTGTLARWAPQEVIEYQVPGSGPVSVTIDTDHPETDGNFDTLVQVRSECSSVPAPSFALSCFNGPIAGSGTRGGGGVVVEGGDTIFIVVTGYSDPPRDSGVVDEGTVKVTITPGTATTPELTSAWIGLTEDFLYQVEGTDADGDVVGVLFNFYDADGLLDIYGDGTALAEQDYFRVPFGAEVGTPFTRDGVVSSADVNLAGYLASVDATEADVRVYDAAGAVSDPVRVPVAEATFVGLGEACELAMPCRPELACVDGFCEAPPVIADACAAATPITVPDFTDEVTVTVTGDIGAGMGNFRPNVDCLPNHDPATAGAELLFALPLPTGSFDLSATTNLDGTGETDTILYARTSCAERATEVACNDDTVMLRSAISATELAGDSTVYLFLEQWGGLMSGTTPVEMSITLTRR